MRFFCSGVTGAVLSTSLLVSPARSAAPDATATMTRLARDLDLQTKMPGPEPTTEIHWSSTHWHIPGTLAEWVLWGALAVGAGFVLWALRDVFPWGAGRRRAKPARPGAIILPTDAAITRLEEAGEDADELARRGRFAEAMHMLLLRSLAEMRKRLDVSIADSLTSREILQRLALPGEGRGALADLIGRVEVVHFGRRPAASEDYGACRASFERLLDALRGPRMSPA